MTIKAKPSTGAFPGFNEEGLQFLKKLSKNNRREWFQPRKAVFEEILQKPMAALLFAVEGEMSKNHVPLATNPKSALFRIYRDIRFSADKTPYNTFVSGALYQNGKKNSPGGLYVHVGEKESYTAAGFWQPERSLLANWRLRMQSEPGEYLDLVKKLKRNKLALSASQSLQRMPRGFEAMEGSPLAELLRLQSFVVVRPLSSEDVTSQDLPKRIARFALAAKPLLEYGWALPEAKPAVFVD
jgi:uncharacterized protein (TIGR02453 family)